MQNLGATRSSYHRDHYLQTPDAFIRAPLPGMHAATAIVHASPACGARFSQYTAEMQRGGTLGPTTAQRFLYGLDGAVKVRYGSSGGRLERGGYSFIPEGIPHTVTAEAESRVSVIEKKYEAADGFGNPEFLLRDESEIDSQAVMGDSAVRARILLPDTPEHDFAVNTLTFEPGASLSIVEMHVMEHGLLMLEGGGIYRLGDSWYPVTAGDFIYMGPFCPQWFGALGKTPSKYLLYKDWNRLRAS